MAGQEQPFSLPWDRQNVTAGHWRSAGS
jgi:hypothetical protein